MTQGRRRRRRKRCRFCHDLFLPDHRQDSPGGNRQYACSKPSCQKARHEKNQSDWLKKHPDAYRGPRIKVKLWRSAHSGYGKEYRENHPQARARDNEKRKERHRKAKIRRAEIQDAISQQPLIEKELKGTLFEGRNAEIQDSILQQLIIISVFISIYLRRARAEIQDPIEPSLCAGYLPPS